MLKVFKRLLLYAFLISVGFSVTFMVAVTIHLNQQIPEYSEVLESVSKNLNHQRRNAVRKSIKSSVRVLSADDEIGGISTSSGTYFKIEDSYYILTVAHGIIGDCKNTAFVTDRAIHECKNIIDLNSVADYAIIEVEEIEEKVAVKYPEDIPSGRLWKEAMSIMNVTYYTGYPNSMGPFTVDGKIVGYNSNDFIYLKSYAWSGSSGSGVFNENGKLIGYVLAINVGRTEYGFNVIEDIIVVVPLFKIDWEEVINKINEEKIDGKE